MNKKDFKNIFFSKWIHDQRYHRNLLHFYKKQYLNNSYKQNKLKLKIKIKKKRKKKKEKAKGILGGPVKTRYYLILLIF